MADDPDFYKIWNDKKVDSRFLQIWKIDFLFHNFFFNLRIHRNCLGLFWTDSDEWISAPIFFGEIFRFFRVFTFRWFLWGFEGFDTAVWIFFVKIHSKICCRLFAPQRPQSSIFSWFRFLGRSYELLKNYIFYVSIY